MLPPGAPGEAHQTTPGVHVPVGGTQTGEGGDQIDAPGVGDFLGIVLGIPALGEQAQLVPQPLDDGAAHKDRPLQGVLDRPVQANGDGGDEPVAALAGGLAGVHEEEAAGAVGVFRLARGEAALAEEGGLLIPGDPGDGHPHPLEVGIAVDSAGVPHLRKDGAGDVQGLKEGLIPAQAADVIEHGAGGVGVVGDVDGAAGELPEQPGVHRAEEEAALVGQGPGPLHMVQEPLDLGGREVGVGDQSGGPPDVLPQALLQQGVHHGGGAAALPDDGVVDGASGLLVPEDGGLPLVGDADGGNVGRVHAGLGQHLHHDAVLGGPDLHGVVLHPALPGIVLGELLLGGAHDALLPVKEDGPGAGSALIQGQQIGRHTIPS